MSSNIFGQLPKKLDATSEKVEKSGGDLDDIEESLVTNTDTFDKEYHN